MSKGGRITTAILATLLIIFGTLLCVQDVTAQEEYVADQLIIKYKKGGNSAAVKARLAERGVPGIKNIPELGLEVIEVPPSELEAIQEEFSQDPDVEYVEKNYYYEPLASPNDQFYPDQLYFDVFQAPQAWDLEIGDPDVVIAVVDTGLDVNHEDLVGGKVLPGCNTVGLDFDNANCNTDLTDHHDHGTGVTGTAAADTNNSIGVAGVCWGCSILPVRVTSDAGTSSLVDIIEGILFAVDYALNNPTKRVIINISLGRPCSGLDQAEFDALNLAWDSGILIVSARGNTSDFTVYCPAIADNVIAVSGTNLDDTLWSSSSWNNVDLAAPAVQIYNIAPGALIDPPYIPTWGGTSFSSAIVSGVSGLVWSANMSMNNWQLDQILRNTADDIGDAVFFGAGRINANAAVVQAPNPPPLPTPTPAPTPVPTPDPTRLSISSIGGVGANTGKGKANVSVSRAEPGSVLLLVWEIQQLGAEPAVVTRGVCEGLTLDLYDPTKIARATASDSGSATFTFNVGKKMQGNSIRVQAYTHSKGTICKKSGSPGKFIPIP